MSVKKVINYPNGGRLLVFSGNGFGKEKVRYIPSPAYEEARKKAQSTSALSPKTTSPFKNSSLLIDKIFTEKTSYIPLGKSQVSNVAKIVSMQPKKDSKPYTLKRAHSPNYLRTASQR